ncbi:uncharacterized protein zgc:193726 isoform X2 [Perca fluviatilis]|uniref:uncharacterized protein zgc:193726 isoform X2 n=1 Tax=Perca fluviatilis TaxID=8168 RepID=UPI001964B95F|nr:uncharacterized protein zgc:193726 isoform X2 [Perca fluviatilis]
MMKAVQSAALSLMMMMMMMVSAGPLPASFDRHDDLNADTSHLLKIREENSTRFESRQHVNNTEDDARFESRQHVNNTEDDTRDVSSNNTVDNMAASTFQFVFPQDKVDLSLGVIKIRCALSTCLTANLAASLQGGEETAGGATTDPFGIGKK